MSAHTAPPDDSDAETGSRTESLDELLADQDHWIDLVEAINHNFVLEVEASHADDGLCRFPSLKIPGMDFSEIP